MRTSKYLLVMVFLLSTQITFANLMAKSSAFFFKDGVLLLIVLAIAAIFKIGQTLFSRD